MPSSPLEPRAAERRLRPLVFDRPSARVQWKREESSIEEGKAGSMRGKQEGNRRITGEREGRITRKKRMGRGGERGELRSEKRRERGALHQAETRKKSSAKEGAFSRSSFA
eukprot:2651009-Pleurochrysis_carterae.AAC.1